jgi:tRNA dimethylallyltransferase
MTLRPAEPLVHLVAGPTASGKSRRALALAEAIGGVIVNADAIQLYKDLSILSARPSPEDEARAPHRLYGVADGAEAWSVGRWLRAAEPALAELAEARRPAIVTGGTGLYFRSLIGGLADIPQIPIEVRAAAAARFDSEGETAFRKALAAIDPKAEARIAPSDRQRLVRALEVHEATGRSLSDWQAETRPLLPQGTWRAEVIEPPRDELYARCDARFTAMVEAGAAEEAERLEARGLDPALPVMKAVGLRELLAWRRGEISREEAIALGQQETRRYAKRQLTWFRNQTPDWPRVGG